jgi:hypothetical protein
VNRGEKGPDRNVGAGYELLTIGVTFALTLTGFALLGVWLDRRLGTMPWLTMAGTLLGTALGGYWVWLRLQGGTDGDGS